MKVKVYFKCAARNCKSKKYVGCGKSFFKFPDEEERIEQWLEALNRTDISGNFRKIKSARVCSDHFSQDMILGSSRFLSRTACPDLKGKVFQKKHKSVDCRAVIQENNSCGIAGNDDVAKDFNKKNDKAIIIQPLRNEETESDATIKRIIELSQQSENASKTKMIHNHDEIGNGTAASTTSELAQDSRKKKRKKRTPNSFTATGQSKYFTSKKRRECITNSLQLEDTLLVENISKVITRLCDENQIFGDFVASELRNITNSDIKRKLKLDIQRSILRYSAMDEGDGSDEGSYTTKTSRSNLD